MLGTDRQYVWNIENGKINLSLDYLDSIIIKLKCRPAFGGTAFVFIANHFNEDLPYKGMM